MATEKQIKDRYGLTHKIEKVFKIGIIDLRILKDNQSVAMGDGKTFYWLLTEKENEDSLP